MNTLLKGTYADGKQVYERCTISLALGKYKLKPWWDTTMHLLGWLKFKILLLMVSNGKGVEQLELSYIVGENTKCSSHSGKESGSLF